VSSIWPKKRLIVVAGRILILYCTVQYGYRVPVQ
jgi:hypothetical protein